MSFDDGKLVTLSDSSDDIGILSDFKKQVPSRQIEPNSSTNLYNSEEADEPDWVRDFTPQSKNNVDQKAAFLASLEDESDDDSVINLISQDPKPTDTKSKSGGSEQTKKVAEPQHSLSTTKRARAPLKPKSKLPLVVAPKLDDSLVLLQSVGGDLDLGGDVGAVGRVKLQDGTLFLDIKGIVYRASVSPCNTLCVVSVGEDEARVTSVLDEVVTLQSERNLFASDEIVVQGDLNEEPDQDNHTPMDNSAEGKETEPPLKKKKSSEMNGKARAGSSKGRGTKGPKSGGRPSRQKK